MSIGLDIAIRTMGFLDLLDDEERVLAVCVHEAEGDERRIMAAMDAARRRFAREIETTIRRLPPLAASDPGLAREIGYALAGLADERILHYPAGGLGAWRERLLETELYGSALAGHEVIERAEAAAYARPEGNGAAGAGPGLLAPFYLGLLRSGFEGELRGDPRREALIAALVEATGKPPACSLPAGERRLRTRVRPLALALTGLAIWLVTGAAVWWVLAAEPLRDAQALVEEIDRVEQLLEARTDR